MQRNAKQVTGLQSCQFLVTNFMVQSWYIAVAAATNSSGLKKVGCCGSNILCAKLDNVFHLNEYGTTKLGECSLFVMINLKIFSNKPCMMMLVQSNETIGSLVIT